MKMNEIGAAWLRENSFGYQEASHWALSECASLAEVWRDARPDWLVWVATRPGVLDTRTLWGFGCLMADRLLPIWYASHPDDHRPRVAIETRRRWIDGKATDAELAAAATDAELAAAAAEEAAAEEGARVARMAWVVAGAAWEARAAEVVRAGAWAVTAAQAQWLRDNATPRFPDDIAQLAATPAGIARACGMENEVEDAQAAVAPC